MSSEMSIATADGVEKRIGSWKIIGPTHDVENRPFEKETVRGTKPRIQYEFGGLLG